MTVYVSESRVILSMFLCVCDTILMWMGVSWCDKARCELVRDVSEITFTRGVTRIQLHMCVLAPKGLAMSSLELSGP